MRYSLLFILILIGGFVQSQTAYPLVTIQDIQTRSAVDLANCADTTLLDGDTVRVQGTVLSSPDSARFTSASRAQFWIQETGTGSSFLGLDVIQFFDPSLNGAGGLLPGDDVILTGIVTEYQGEETELIPLEGYPIEILASNLPLEATPISLSDLNDVNQINQIASGEQWEGMYVELTDLTVVSVDYFSSDTRVSFVVQDGNGNKINVGDKFRVQALPAGSPAGSFIPPNPNDLLTSLKGIITHSKNGCPGENGRGYEIQPTQPSDYQISSASPAIISVDRNYVTPTSSQDVTVTAEVIDEDGIETVMLYYAVGVSSTSYTSVPMNVVSGNVYSADISAQVDGAFVKYYVTALDSSGLSSAAPNVPGGLAPLFYRVRDNGTTIYDLQYVPQQFGSTSSAYAGLEVTVTGVVTGSAESDNLGFVFIQQENLIEWAGIMVLGNASLATLKVGDMVEVTGVVEENFGYTRMNNISSVVPAGTGTINPLTLSPEIFTSYSDSLNEKYEGMLVQIENPTGGDMYVVNTNPDDPNNYAEFRVGSDPFSPDQGCRVIAGRQTGSAFSSLNVSYVNDSSWATLDGTMQVPMCVVQLSDTISSVKGIMMYSFGAFKITPRNNEDIVANKVCLVGMDNDIKKYEVVAYPNPANQTLHLEYDIIQSGNTLNVSMVNVMGQTLISRNLSTQNGKTELDLSSLVNGTYFLRVQDAENGINHVEKIVVFK